MAEFVTFPLEALVIRLQMQQGYQSGLFSMFLMAVTKEGSMTMWKGATPAVCRQVVTGGIGVGLYPVVRRVYVGQESEPQMRQRICAGATTGAVAQFIASPLDVVKVRLQVQATEVARGKQPTYRGMIDAFVRIGRNEGIPGYFRGLSPSLFRAAAQYGVGTATYDVVKHKLVHTRELPDTTSTHMLASVASGLASAIAGCPADVVKTRMIAQLLHGGRPIYRNTLDCMLQTVAKDGVRGMYKGFLPTWMRLAPWQLIFFVAFEQISLLLTGHTFPTK